MGVKIIIPCSFTKTVLKLSRTVFSTPMAQCIAASTFVSLSAFLLRSTLALNSTVRSQLIVQSIILVESVTLHYP
jgi:hypothetical protein